MKSHKVVLREITYKYVPWIVWADIVKSFFKNHIVCLSEVISCYCTLETCRFVLCDLQRFCIYIAFLCSASWLMYFWIFMVFSIFFEMQQILSKGWSYCCCIFRWVAVCLALKHCKILPRQLWVLNSFVLLLCAPLKIMHFLCLTVTPEWLILMLKLLESFWAARWAAALWGLWCFGGRQSDL